MFYRRVKSFTTNRGASFAITEFDGRHERMHNKWRRRDSWDVTHHNQLLLACPVRHDLDLQLAEIRLRSPRAAHYWLLDFIYLDDGVFAYLNLQLKRRAPAATTESERDGKWQRQQGASGTVSVDLLSEGPRPYLKNANQRQQISRHRAKVSKLASTPQDIFSRNRFQELSLLLVVHAGLHRSAKAASLASCVQSGVE